MDSVKTGSNKCEKVFCLHSEHKKSGIVCVFYEIDRKLPSIDKGTLVLWVYILFIIIVYAPFIGVMDNKVVSGYLEGVLLVKH